MRVSTLNSELLSLILYGYSKGIPIIKAAIEKESKLDTIIKLYESPPDSKFNIHKYNPGDIQFLYKIGILSILPEGGYFLTTAGEDIARKLKREMNIYKNLDIDYRNLDVNRILKTLCNELIVDNDPNKYRFYPIFKVIYENYDKQFLTPKLIGKYGIILLVLYNGENNCDKCKNWTLSLKNVIDYLYKLSIECQNKFGNRINVKQLEIYELVTRRGHKGNIRYRLTEDGYNVAEYILKNLAIIYK